MAAAVVLGVSGRVFVGPRDVFDFFGVQTRPIARFFLGWARGGEGMMRCARVVGVARGGLVA